VISRACRRAGIRVALSGLGADEFSPATAHFRGRWRPAAGREAVLRTPSPTPADGIGAGRCAFDEGAKNRRVALHGRVAARFLPLPAPGDAQMILEQLLHPVTVNMGGADLHPGVWRDLLRCAQDADPISAVSMLEATAYMVSTLMRDSDQMEWPIRSKFACRLSTAGSPKRRYRFPERCMLLPVPRACCAWRCATNCVRLGRSAENKGYDPIRSLVKGGTAGGNGKYFGFVPEFPFRPGSVRRVWNAFLAGIAA